MSDKSDGGKSGGVGFFGVLTLIFITLKLCNMIAWSWVWVLSPCWGSAILMLGLLVLMACLQAAAGR